MHDSGSIKRLFAEDLGRSAKVRAYAKFPLWLKVLVPLGPYEPYWIIVIADDDQKRSNPTVEAKGDIRRNDHRRLKDMKVDVGEALRWLEEVKVLHTTSSIQMLKDIFLRE